MIESPILPGISIRLIQILCAEHYRISPEEMRSANRQREFAWPRQMAMALCLEFLAAKGAPWVGHYFGGRDHATVLHAQRAVIDRADRDPKICADLAILRAAIEAHRPLEIQLDLSLAA